MGSLLVSHGILCESGAFSLQQSLSILQGCPHAVSRLRIVEVAPIASFFQPLARGSACEHSEAASRTRSCSTGYSAHRLEGVSYMSIGAQVGEPIQSVSGLSQFPTKTVDGCDHLLEIGLQLQQFGLILWIHPFVLSSVMMGPSRVQRSSPFWVIVRRRRLYVPVHVRSSMWANVNVTTLRCTQLMNQARDTHSCACV